MSIRPDCDVAILSINYPPESAGIAPYAGGLASGLTKAGHRLTAHTAHPHYPEWSIRNGYGQWTFSEIIDGVTVQRRLHYVPKSPRGVRRLLSELSFGFRLLSARLGAPRVVIAISPSLFSTAMFILRVMLTPRRPKVALWVQDIYTLGLGETGEAKGFVTRAMRWVESLTLRAADSVVVIHDRFANYVVNELHVDSARVFTIRNWTHLPETRPVEKDEARQALGWPQDITLAVHTGNMGKKQGLENIVAAAKLADAGSLPLHFFLIGDGGERRRLEEAATGISRLTFLDPLEPDEFLLALQAADVLIVNEKLGVSSMAVPSKLTSYFDAGRPVVAATDPCGITASEIRAAEAGTVVNAGDPNALLDAILRIVSDPVAIARFSQNGRLYRVQHLDETAAIHNWEQIIDRLFRERD